MLEGGRILTKIRQALADAVRPGTTLIEIEELARRLIRRSGAKPSFTMVPGYGYATCLSVNDGVVHGIPTGRKVMTGDLVSIDIGVYFKGFHTDTATTVIAGKGSSIDRLFVQTGQRALSKAIAQARAGKRVGDISFAIQQEVETAGYSCVRSLSGHGIGRELHEEPAVPCLLFGQAKKTPLLQSGQALAIEVIYTMGGHELTLQDDGWTLATSDASVAGLFEKTVMITEGSPLMITK